MKFFWAGAGSIFAYAFSELPPRSLGPILTDSVAELFIRRRNQTGVLKGLPERDPLGKRAQERIGLLHADQADFGQQHAARQRAAIS